MKPLPNTVGLSAAMRDFMDWGRRQFPSATPASCMEHLREEIEELAKELSRRPTPPESEAEHLEYLAWKLRAESEVADVLALTYHFAMVAGINPVEGLRKKLLVNQRRVWGPNGRHVP